MMFGLEQVGDFAVEIIDQCEETDGSLSFPPGPGKRHGLGYQPDCSQFGGGVFRTNLQPGYAINVYGLVKVNEFKFEPVHGGCCMCAGLEAMSPDIVREPGVTAEADIRQSSSGDPMKAFLCWKNIVQIFEQERSGIICETRQSSSRPDDWPVQVRLQKLSFAFVFLPVESPIRLFHFMAKNTGVQQVAIPLLGVHGVNGELLTMSSLDCLDDVFADEWREARCIWDGVVNNKVGENCIEVRGTAEGSTISHFYE